MLDSKRVFCRLCLVLIAHCAFAQVAENTSCENVIEIAKEYYEQGAYLESIEKLEDILATSEAGMIAETYVYLALNYIAIGDKPTAKGYFKRALNVEPKLQLDAYEVTPEILAIFEEAKKERRYESACCSCFIPGFGQMMKGEERKGRVLIAASAITLTGTLISWAVTNSKHDYYRSLSPNDIDQMVQAYHDYNRWYKITIVSGIAFVGIYIYSVVDAGLVRTSTKDRRAENQTGMYLKPRRESISIGYSTNF